MPVPTKLLSNLEFYLKEVKTRFNDENSELRSWMQERGLKLENLGTSSSKKQVTNSVERQVFDNLINKKAKKNSLETQISLEEFNVIFDKLRKLLKEPAKQLETELELYLEQQLSDILSFEVSGELEKQRLNYATGTMLAEPHLKRFPNDVLENHENILEANIDVNRSSFGWFMNSMENSNRSKDYEKYYFSLQLYQLPSWQEKNEEIKKWYKFRKMVVINPYEKVAVVGVVGNIDHSFNIKKQFGGSPEVITEGKIWSPKTQGKVLMMFVNDVKNKIPLGVINLNTLINKDD